MTANASEDFETSVWEPVVEPSVIRVGADTFWNVDKPAVKM